MYPEKSLSEWPKGLSPIQSAYFLPERNGRTDNNQKVVLWAKD